MKHEQRDKNSLHLQRHGVFFPLKPTEKTARQDGADEKGDAKESLD